MGRQVLLVLLALSFLPGASSAYFERLQASARATSFGGAYSAVANDASAAFYNPAAMVAMNRADTSRTVTVPPGNYVNVLTDTNVTGGAMVLAPRSFVVLAPR